MKIPFLATLIAAIIFTQNLQAQTILNGSFENNSGSCQTNIPNATYNTGMQNSVAFGTAGQLDIMDNTCGLGSAQSGNWFVGMATDITGANTDALSLALSAPLTIGTSYTLSYYDRKDPGYATNPLEIGISTNSALFGTQIFISPTPVTGWTPHTVTFTASVAATYLTVHVVGNAYSWTHIDNFSLTPNSTGGNIAFVDACFSSATVGTSFFGSGDLGNFDADLLEWDGNTWTGGWSNANLTIPPPTDSTGCRGIFIGNSVSWTSGGESFGVRTTQPLVSGQNYSITFTYVSHGYGSDGAFSPYIYTNTNSSVTGAYSMGQLPPAGYTWATNTLSFTASPSQAGHNWVMVSTSPSGSSGIVSSFCSNCHVIPQTNSPLHTSITPTFASCSGVCNGSATVTATGGTPPYHYSWQTTNDTTAITDSLCGGNSYRVTVTDSLGASVIDSVFLPVVDPFTVTITSSVPGICPGAAADICAPTGFLSYSWNTGDTTTCVHTMQPGNYIVTVTNSGNCSVISNQLVLAANPSPQDSIHAPQTVFCASDSAQICSDAGFVSYIWNTGALSQCIYAHLAGNYYVTVTDNNGCTASSNHLFMQVHPLPPVSISVNGDTLSAYNAVSYQWYLDGNPISGGNTPVYIAHQAGSYTVQVTDLNGCLATSNAVVFNPTGISGSGTQNPALSIYPNPNSTGTWQIQASNEWLGSKLEILDAEGRLVFNSEIRIPHLELSFEAARGVYLLRIINAERSASFKLVKW